MAIATVNPTTGRTEAVFEAHDAVEVERRLALAAAAVPLLAQVDFAQRAKWMRRSADLLDAEVEELARILTVEMGKTLVAARAEVTKCAKGMRFYADHAAEFLADEPLDDPSSVGASKAYARYQPLGVVLAVMPWNFPLWQVVRFAAPALMAGNVGLLKHASNVPQTALYLDSLYARGGFPRGAFQALLVTSGVVEGVIKDPRVRAVTLTGSEGAGRAVAGVAGAQIKKAVLELGGSDPFIVMPSADLDKAVSTAVVARTQNNGQSCIAAKRFIVHADIYADFAARFSKALEALTVGDPLLEGTDVGPLATKSGREDLVELVDDALAKGAHALVGGTSMDRAGWFYPPTLIEGLDKSMRMYREETFGPVAALYRVANAEEAVELANDSSFGLSSSVWTQDTNEQALFVEGLEAGAVFVNGMTVSYPELPFGGVKDSGFGRELAAAGIREFCNLKTIWTA